MTKSILYIEDYPVVQTIYVEALKKKGFNVDVAEDGQQAFEKVQDNNKAYDLILLDLLLPQTSGLEFLKKYRALDTEKQNGTKVVVLTDFDSPATVKEANDLKIDGYWIKVNNIPSVLAQKVSKLLS